MRDLLYIYIRDIVEGTWDYKMSRRKQRHSVYNFTFVLGKLIFGADYNPAISLSPTGHHHREQI